MKKAVVISLGGSLIVPEKMNVKFLDEFRKTLRKYYSKYKFVVVCGGGTIARKYISALREKGKSEKELADAGIRATRMNALFMMQLFGKEANDELPLNMNEVKNNLAKNKIVICGALRHEKHSTSDGTAAKLAHFLGTNFINMTNVQGLYSENPKTNPKARFISSISWKDFEKMALKIKFEVGQNFVLDQQAARIIRMGKIKTYILGSDLRNLGGVLGGKGFVGTRIES